MSLLDLRSLEESTATHYVLHGACGTFVTTGQDATLTYHRSTFAILGVSIPWLRRRVLPAKHHTLFASVIRFAVQGQTADAVAKRVQPKAPSAVLHHRKPKVQLQPMHDHHALAQATKLRRDDEEWLLINEDIAA
jgi:hypothetical protein